MAGEAARQAARGDQGRVGPMGVITGARDREFSHASSCWRASPQAPAGYAGSI